MTKEEISIRSTEDFCRGANMAIDTIICFLNDMKIDVDPEKLIAKLKEMNNEQ